MSAQSTELLFQTTDHAELEFELTKRDIEIERTGYLALRGRVDRSRDDTGKPLDTALATEFGYKEKRMNYLLEELFGKMVDLGIAGAEDVPPQAC